MLPGGLNWPMDLTVGDDGKLYVADGTYFYVVAADGSLQTVGMLFSPGYPGFLRGLAPAGDGEFVVTTSGGQVARYRPAANETDYRAADFDQLYGVAIGVAGLQKPQGILVSDVQLYIVDAGSKEVISFDLNSKARNTIASGARSRASRRDAMAPCTFRPTRTASWWRCAPALDRMRDDRNHAG